MTVVNIITERCKRANSFGGIVAKYSESWLNQLKSKSDLVDIMSKFTYLEKKGGKYWACCPFHKEKTASFVVNPEEQYYHCFGCGKSGNVITFLMEYDKKTYSEAIEWLAARAGMELPSEESPEVKQARIMHDKGVAANKLAARYYYGNLSKPEGRVALDYIAQRGIGIETLKEFGMGYSANGYGMPKFLMENGYDVSTMKYAGLVSITDNGKPIDFFNGRLIIPIINANGQIIGFGGRVLEKGKTAKYKNTSGTPLFDKRRTLFGINLIKKLQQKENIDSLILVEGYMDVISLSQAGIKNVIASMGTSLTLEQCAEIKRYTKNIYVCFDGDAAGQGATWRSLDMLANAGLEVRVVSMPEGLDPDDTIKKYGKAGYLDIVDKALPLIDFKIHTIANRYVLSTTDGKNKFVKATLPLFAEMDEIEKSAYAKQVSQLSGLAEEAILNGISNYIARPQPKRQEEKPVDPAFNSTEITSEFKARIIACRFILSSILHLKSYVGINDVSKDFFFYPPHVAIYDYILRCIENKTAPVMGDLFDVIPENHDELNKIIEAIDSVSAPQQESYYKDSLARLKKIKEEEAIKEIVKKISEAETLEERKKYQEEYRKLTQK